MLRRLLRPAALLSHLLVLGVVVTCVLLGQWQLQRRAEVRAENQLLEQRLAAAPVDVADLAADPAGIDPAALEYRRVRVTGVFQPEDEVLQRNRAHQGQAGFDVLTPLAYAPGEVVLVRRGWVPAHLDRPPVADAAPPAGEVTVSGFLERSVPQPGFGARDPQTGDLALVFHADLERLAPQLDGALFPLLVHLEDPVPQAFDELPRPQPRPEFDDANHLSYAVQWNAFAVIALVTYLAWWRTRLRRTGRDTPEADRQPSPPPRAHAGT